MSLWHEFEGVLTELNQQAADAGFGWHLAENYEGALSVQTRDQDPDMFDEDAEDHACDVVVRALRGDATCRQAIRLLNADNPSEVGNMLALYIDRKVKS